MTSCTDLPRSTSLASDQLAPLAPNLATSRSSRKRWLRLLAGAALPVTLLAAHIMPAPTSHAAPRAVASSFALTSTLSAFAGDAGLSDADLAELTGDVFDGTAGWGAPIKGKLTAPVAVNAANIRTGPSTSFESLGKLDTSMAVTLLGRSGEWFQVRTARGTQGWMSGEVLRVDAATAANLPLVQGDRVSAKQSSAVTTDTGIRVRTGPATTFESIGKLGAGIKVDVLAHDGGWYKVQTPSGVTGWVTADYLRISAAPAATAATPAVVAATPAASTALVGFTTDDGVKLRQGPGTSYSQLLKFTENTKLTIVGKHDEWYKVRTSKGNSGWVSAEMLSVNPGVASRVPAVKSIPAAPTAPAVTPAVSRSVVRARRRRQRPRQQCGPCRAAHGGQPLCVGRRRPPRLRLLGRAGLCLPPARRLPAAQSVAAVQLALRHDYSQHEQPAARRHDVFQKYRRPRHHPRRHVHRPRDDGLGQLAQLGRALPEHLQQLLEAPLGRRRPAKPQPLALLATSSLRWADHHGLPSFLPYNSAVLKEPQ